MIRLVSARMRRGFLLSVVASGLLAGQSAISRAEPKEPPRSQNPAELVPFIEAMRAYLDVIDRLHNLTHDPGSAGVAGVFGSLEILKATKTPQEVIDYFNKLLPEVKNESVQRAIRIELADLYKSTNQPDKALDQLRILIISAPADHPGPAARNDRPKPEAPVAAAPATTAEKAEAENRVLRLYHDGLVAEGQADWATAASRYREAQAFPKEVQPTDLDLRRQLADSLSQKQR